MLMSDAILITIIAERLLKNQLTELILEKGSKGYTITDAVGEGSRGIRAHDFEGRNIKIETIVNEEIGSAIVQAVSETYFENYAVITYTMPVKVVRGDKYL